MISVLIFFLILLLFLSYLENNKYIRPFFLTNENSGENSKNICLSAASPLREYEPLYLTTTRIQKIYVDLIKTLENMSPKNKVAINNSTKETYIQGTTPNVLKEEINEISKSILKQINKPMGMNFYNITPDVITISTDEQGNKNFIYNFFAYDYNEELNIRFYVDIVKYYYEKSNDIKTTIGFPKFDINRTFEIGFPQPEQSVPLPTNLITTGIPDILNNRGINIPTFKKGCYYLNKIEIYDTNAVINGDATYAFDKLPICKNSNEANTLNNRNCLKNMESVSGYPDKKLDTSAVKFIDTPIQDKSVKYNKWIRPEGEPKLDMFPCRKLLDWWDKDGIQYTSGKNCEGGIQGSFEGEPLAPQFWNSWFALPRETINDAWLFSLTRKDTATQGADFTSDF